MLTERERFILLESDSDFNIDFITDKLSDEEIKSDLDVFKRFKSFNNSKRMPEILMQLTDEELKKVYDNDLYMYDIPEKLELKDMLSLIDRGVQVLTSDFTRKYIFYIYSNRELLVKYKHLISVETFINNIARYSSVPNIFLEVFYDELTEVSTRTILVKLGVTLDDSDPFSSNFEFGLLIDRLRKLQTREFKDEEIIKSLLKVIADYATINNGNRCEDFLKYFDDDFIIQNIECFNPIQLYNGHRLTEDMYQKILDNNNLCNRYGHYLQQACMHELSLDFITNNIDKLNSYFFAFQKNVIEIYKKFPDKVDLARAYFHNTYLSEEEKLYLGMMIEGKPIDELMKAMKIDDYTPQIAIDRLGYLIK